MTTSDTEAGEDHVNQARDFLAKSRKHLTQSDLHQASEKGWGTATHMVTAVAIAQGWEYERHSATSDKCLIWPIWPPTMIEPGCCEAEVYPECAIAVSTDAGSPESVGELFARTRPPANPQYRFHH